MFQLLNCSSVGQCFSLINLKPIFLSDIFSFASPRKEYKSSECVYQFMVVKKLVQ